MQDTYAIIKASGTQWRVSEGDTLRLDRVSGEPGAEIVFPNVMLLSNAGSVEIGKPFVSGARVVGEIVRHMRAKKIRVFQFKRKKGYQRTIGHRSNQTVVRIKSIVAG